MGLPLLLLKVLVIHPLNAVVRLKQQARKLIEAKTKEFEGKFTSKTGGSSTMDATQAYEFAMECGFAPRASDLMEYEASNPGGITLSKFMEMMAQFGSVTETEDDLMVLFKRFDPTSAGKLSKKQFVNVMTNFGEPLSLEETQFILEDLGLDTDPVDYVKFVHLLMQTA